MSFGKLATQRFIETASGAMESTRIRSLDESGGYRPRAGLAVVAGALAERGVEKDLPAVTRAQAANLRGRLLVMRWLLVWLCSLRSPSPSNGIADACGARSA
jgi:hypothetical protein